MNSSARALSHFDRVTQVARESVRMARAAASIALPGSHRWQPPTEVSRLHDKHVFEAGLFLKRGTARDGSGRGSANDPGWTEKNDQSEAARGGNSSHRAASIINAGTRVFRGIPDLSRVMNALSRVEGSVDLGNTGAATSDLRKCAKPMLASNTDARNRARAGHETKRFSFVDAGDLANVRVAPSIRGVTPPSGLSQRQFAPPSSDVRGSSDNSGRAAITINSSPTVVINAAAGGALQHDVIGALRAHREELFDQLKRESARRERAQF
jgi:hypothetical protein